jgi:hypothetical protein
MILLKLIYEPALDRALRSSGIDVARRRGRIERVSFGM